MTIFNPRPDTQDRWIVDEIHTNNCYRLPDSLNGITIIDIGANIGSFVAACVERNVDKVIAFEPERSNFDQLDNLCFRHNWHHVKRFEGAVVGRGRGRFTYLIDNPGYHGSIKLTGGYTISCAGKIPVPCFSVEQVLTMASSGNGVSSVVWIKLDCEGSEHEIIEAMKQIEFPLLEPIQKVFGEVHTVINSKMSRNTEQVCEGFTLPSHEEFKLSIERIGFDVIEMVENPDDPCLALFWAERK